MPISMDSSTRNTTRCTEFIKSAWKFQNACRGESRPVALVVLSADPRKLAVPLLQGASNATYLNDGTAFYNPGPQQATIRPKS